MISNLHLVLIVGVVATIAQTALGFSCYDCDNYQGTGKENCGEIFKMDGIDKKDCMKGIMPMKNATGCMKRIYEVNGAKVIKRECYSGDMKDKRACETYVSGQTNNFGDKILDCHVCPGDLCNSSNDITVMSVGLFLATLFARNLF